MKMMFMMVTKVPSLITMTDGNCDDCDNLIMMMLSIMNIMLTMMLNVMTSMMLAMMEMKMLITMVIIVIEKF